MADNAYMNFGADVTFGESQQKGFEGKFGWILLEDWSFQITAEADSRNTGMSAGKADAGEFNFTHPFDTASPALLSKMVAGVQFDVVTVVMLKTTGDIETPGTFFKIVFKSAFVTAITTKGAADGTMSQEVEMVFTEMYVGYKPQDNTGKLGPAIPFDWSLITGQLATNLPGKLK